MTHFSTDAACAMGGEVSERAQFSVFSFVKKSKSDCLRKEGDTLSQYQKPGLIMCHYFLN